LEDSFEIFCVEIFLEILFGNLIRKSRLEISFGILVWKFRLEILFGNLEVVWRTDRQTDRQTKRLVEAPSRSLKRAKQAVPSSASTGLNVGDKIHQLDEKAGKLKHTHKDNANVIYEKQRDIHEEWTHLCAKANLCKIKL